MLLLLPRVRVTSALPLFLIAFYGFTLGGPYALGKLAAVAFAGICLGDVRRRDSRLMLAYVVAVIWTTALSADLWLSVFGMWGTYSNGLLACLVLIPYWACVDARHRAGLELGIRLGGMVMALVGVAQFAGYLLPWPLPEGQRVFSTMGSPVYVGAMAALCFPFCRRLSEKVLMLFVLWACGSRGAWVAVSCGTIYQTWPAISERVRYWGLVAIGGGLCGAFYLRPLSDMGRVITWRAAWDGFLSRPWFGWGPGNYYMVAELWRNPLWDEVYGNTTQDHAHNLFLEAAATSGLVGLAALCGLLYAVWRETTDNRKARAALLGVFLVGMLNPLPLVVKALCLMLAASSSTRKEVSSKIVSHSVKGFVCILFFLVSWLIHNDRLMKYWNDTPWSSSSVKAAYRVSAAKEPLDIRTKLRK